ncbi:MAG: TonB-dependent receptor [Flavobacteriaceae bacterium]
MKKSFLLFSAILGTLTAFAQQVQKDTVQTLDSVYIDTKVPISRKNSGKMVTVISSETLRQFQGKSLAQVLNSISGFELNGSHSNNGQTLGYYVRGGKNRQVLIVVDGVPQNDASQIANDYDLRLIPLDEIERIEVLKGAASTLYGSGAATAVISITTKKASKSPIAIHTQTMLGTDRSAEASAYPLKAINNSIQVSGTMGSFFYKAEAQHRFSNGLSAIEALEGAAPFEEDSFNAFQSKIQLGVHYNENISISQFVAFNQLENDFDDFSYTDADYSNKTLQYSTGGHFEWCFGKGTYVFNDLYSVIKRDIASSFPAKYESKTYQFDNYLQYTMVEPVKLILGLGGNFSRMNAFTIPFGATEFSKDIDADQAHLSYIDPYVNVLFTSSLGLNVNAGARLNMHSLYGNHWVYQFNPSYYLKLNRLSIKWLASYSTAYSTPSLYQIYDPFYGNTHLQPEANTTIEGGIELSSGKSYRLGLLYFQRFEKQFIDFVAVDPDTFAYQYQNSDAVFKYNGLETQLYLRFSEQWDGNFNYTFTHPDEAFRIRIPKHKVNAILNYEPTSKTQIGFSYHYVSEREDRYLDPSTFENKTVFLKAYHLLNLTANHRVTKQIHLFVSLDNVLNSDFEELYRYQSKGRNISMGFGLDL